MREFYGTSNTWPSLGAVRCHTKTINFPVAALAWVYLNWQDESNDFSLAHLIIPPLCFTLYEL